MRGDQLARPWRINQTKKSTNEGLPVLEIGSQYLTLLHEPGPSPKSSYCQINPTRTPSNVLETS